MEKQETTNKRHLRNDIILVTVLLLFAIACGAVMLFFGRELGLALYNSAETGNLIALFAPLVPVMYLDTATDSVLKGLDEQVYCMKINTAFCSIC